MNSSYREQIFRESLLYCDLADTEFDKNKEELVPESIVSGIIDDIESEVNSIMRKLAPITGLMEIDEIKEQISKLGEKL